jgi:uncharacterized membrane protein
MNLKPLDEFLDQLERPLHRLSVSERQEWREEARQHLVYLAEAHEELGASPDEALQAAMRQFGNPQRISRELVAASQGPERRIQAAYSTAVLLSSATLYREVLTAPRVGHHVLIALAVLALGHFLLAGVLGRVSSTKVSRAWLIWPFTPLLVITAVFIAAALPQVLLGGIETLIFSTAILVELFLAISTPAFALWVNTWKAKSNPEQTRHPV